VAAFTNKGYRERIGLYREYVYEKGGISDGSVIDHRVALNPSPKAHVNRKFWF